MPHVWRLLECFLSAEGLTSCQRNRGGQGARGRVSSLLCIIPQLCLLVCSLFLLHSFIQCNTVSSSGLMSFTPFPPLFLCSCPVFYFPPFVAPSCWHAPSPPRRTHARIDLTISAIQPPKSNYHGHNAVIKSNGLLDEAPTLKLNKSFSTLLHIILCATLPGTMNCVHSSAYNLLNFTESYLKLFHTVEQHHINSKTLFSSCLCGFVQFPPTAGKNCKLAFSVSVWVNGVYVLRWPVDLSRFLSLTQFEGSDFIWGSG